MQFQRFLVFIFSLFFSQILAQDNFSESFFYFTRNIQLHNPSIVCAENDMEGSLAYRTYTGKLSVIRSYYADLNFNLRKKELASPEHSKHVVGIGFYNDREGDFFTKARILSRYAVHIPLRDNLFLSGGASFHLINYNFNASGAGASGSGWTYSGSVGTTLYSSSFKIGVSFNDMNSPTVRPISYDFTIPRYVTFYGEKLQELSENIKVKGAGRCNWKPNTSVNYIIQLGLVFSNTLGLSGFYYDKKGTGLAVDLTNIKVSNGFADLSFAYLSPSKNVNPSVSQYELNLRFYIDR
jgi:hypothetical protein